MVAILARLAEETYQEGSVGPFMTSLVMRLKDPPSVTVSSTIGSHLSSLNFENLNSELVIKWQFEQRILPILK